MIIMVTLTCYQRVIYYHHHHHGVLLVCARSFCYYGAPSVPHYRAFEHMLIHCPIYLYDPCIDYVENAELLCKSMYRAHSHYQGSLDQLILQITASRFHGTDENERRRHTNGKSDSNEIKKTNDTNAQCVVFDTSIIQTILLHGI
jgi:hypothetical protein